MINKSDSRCTVVRFCYHLYDYRPNWTPLGPITIIKLTFIACHLLQLEGRLKKKEPEEQKIKEEVDDKVQVITCHCSHLLSTYTVS